MRVKGTIRFLPDSIQFIGLSRIAQGVDRLSIRVFWFYCIWIFTPSHKGITRTFKRVCRQLIILTIFKICSFFATGCTIAIKTYFIGTLGPDGIKCHSINICPCDRLSRRILCCCCIFICAPPNKRITFFLISVCCKGVI